eukprot:m.41259 g.41259  ORF g.41259 m.41259 type:complete len:365 (-) comp11442_c0_seq1:113-1207(-)
MAKAVVLDAGSCTVKAGFAGDDSPRCVVPTLIGHPRNPLQGVDSFVGHDAIERETTLLLKPAVDRGVVVNWNDMTEIYRHVFEDKLEVTVSGHPVILSESPVNPKQNREKMAQIMFETFRCPSLSLAPTPVLALYAAGKTTGCVVDVGASTTSVTAIFEGCATRDSFSASDLAGNQVDALLQKLVPASLSARNARSLKEMACFVAEDFEQQCQQASKQASTQTFKLPDGSSVSLGSNMFRCPEVLFRPSLLGQTRQLGLVEQVLQAIDATPCDIHRGLLSSVVVCGGTSTLPGFVQRIHKDLNTATPHGVSASVMPPRGQGTAAFVGAAIFAASHQNDASRWMSKSEYQEYGASGVHTKFRSFT